MSYGFVVWGNASCSYIDKIRSLQKRALKAIVSSHKENNIDIIRSLQKRALKAIVSTHKENNINIIRSLQKRALYSIVSTHEENNINIIRSLQKRALKAIVSSHKENNIDIIHYNLQILNINHRLQLQLSSLMWDYDHDTLPLSLRVHFQKGKSCI